MFEHCEMLRWNTPLSDALAISQAAIIGEEQLSITLQAQHQNSVELWCLKFPRNSSYLVSKHDQSPETCREMKEQGWTLVHTNSDKSGNVFMANPVRKFLAKLDMTVSHPGKTSKHFRIATDKVAIDVFCDQSPEFHQIGRKKLSNETLRVQLQ